MKILAMKILIPPEFMERTDWQLLSADNIKVVASMRHNGLSFRDIDKSGHPKIWELMSLCWSSRIFIHHVSMDDSGNTFRDFKELTKDHMTFLVTGELNFFKPLYDLSILNKPLILKVEGGYIGNTSFNALTTVTLESSGTALLTNVNQVVYIDPETRKPTPLPNWWKEKYAESAKDKSSLRIDKFERPPETGHGRTQVTWTFTNNYNYANWTSYARYALDIAYLCSKQGSLKHFAENIKNGISKIQLHYYGESLEGDYLDVMYKILGKYILTFVRRGNPYFSVYYICSKFWKDQINLYLMFAFLSLKMFFILCSLPSFFL